MHGWGARGVCRALALLGYSSSTIDDLRVGDEVPRERNRSRLSQVAALTELPLLLPLPNRPRFSPKSRWGGARSLGRAEPDSGSGGSRKGVPRALALARRGESMVQRVRGGLGRSWSAPEPRYGHTSTLTRRLDCTGVV